MSTAKNQSVSKLKQTVSEMEMAHRRHDELMDERERLEIAISGSEKEEERKALKESLLEVDQLLDLTDEENFDTQIHGIREQLIHEILEQYPDERMVYQEMMTSIERLESSIEQAKRALESVEKVENALQRATAAWEQPISARIFFFIFGKSPSAEISRQLERIEKLSPEVRDTVSEFQQGLEDPAVTSELTAQILEFLNGLEAQVKQKWTFTMIRTVYTPSKRAVQHFVLRLNDAQGGLEEQIVAVEKKTESWIERIAQQAE
jgi:hypothetical protein